jgi:16S rRNA (guanine1207-N2)-methyltransferase
MAPSQYFESEPTVASQPVEFTAALPDLTLRLRTDRGVFSHGSLDTGTRLLLMEAPTPAQSGDALDIGCGAGPIAVALARRAPGATVWAIDVNERARHLTEENAAANAAPNVRVVAPDDVPGDIRFTTIWSNPPIRIGKAALHELLLRWLPRLAPTGEAILVVQKHLGADSLAGWLGLKGFAVERFRSRAGFRLLRVTPDPSDAGRVDLDTKA